MSKMCKFIGQRGGICTKQSANGILCEKHYKMVHKVDIKPENKIPKINNNKSTNKLSSIKYFKCCVDDCTLESTVCIDGKYICYRHR